MKKERPVNPDIIRLEGLLHAVEDAEHHLSANNDPKTRLQAIIYNIMIMGEISRKLSASIKAKHPHIPWKNIGDMRNFLIHEYGRVDAQKVMDVVHHDFPKLKEQIATLFQKLDADDTARE